MTNVLRAGSAPIFTPDVEALLGTEADTMEELDARAHALFPDAPPIVWECDACSLQFLFVGAGAEGILGYPKRRWLEPRFWVDHVVHVDDRDDAVNYCALATAKGRDHWFEYRAAAADGRLVWLRDFVKVIAGPRGMAASLRGVMFDITAEKAAQPSAPPARQPSRVELGA